MNTPLTPRRLFSDPPLTVATPAGLKFTPDGQRLTYVRTSDDDRERMDLWQVDITTGIHSVLLDARELTEETQDVSELTSQERAERERRRQFAHGITSYAWHRDGKRLLIPQAGRAVLVDVNSPRTNAQWLAPQATRQSGFVLSPDGTFLSYVRDGDLHLWHVEESVETQITDDASATLNNGLPDFLAAEEMHRFEGHWWARDEGGIYYCKVDESGVELSYRMEMQADGAQTVEQRYPFAGATNPQVELWYYDLANSQHKQIWTESAQQAYLARVVPGDGHVLVLTQDRLQQHLRLLRHELADPSGVDGWQELHHQESETWINLTDDLRILDDARVLLTTERSGTREVLLLAQDGSEEALHGPSHINHIAGVTADHIYACGWQDDPQQNHLFEIALNGSSTRQVTREEGCHELVMSADCSKYIDRFSSPDVPVRLSICHTQDASLTQVLQNQTISDEHPYSAFAPLHSSAVFGSIDAEDGQKLYYRLTPPSNPSGKHATIVYVYGGPGPQKSRKDWGSLMLQMFAQNGFGVLELDNRGTGNRGAAFEAPIYRQLGQAEVRDQVAGLKVLRSHSWADLSRVGVFGHSYGGYMSLMCLCQASAHFRSGVAVAPVSDWALYDSHYTERFMGMPQENVEGYRQSNVLTHLDQLEAPLLLMHGLADDNVLFTHSTKIMAKLQNLGKPFELMTYPGAKHSMQEQDVSIHRFEMILDFFQRTLNLR